MFRTVGTSLSIAGIAALTSATSATSGGAEYPTPRTFHLAFAGCAAMLLVAGGLALLVPRKGFPSRSTSGILEQYFGPQANRDHAADVNEASR